MTVCGWHMRILLRIPTALILWDFDFLRGLSRGRLDGFSTGRYEENCESFDLYAARIESGAMRFSGGKSFRRWNPFETRPSVRVHWVACGTCTVPDNFLKLVGH